MDDFLYSLIAQRVSMMLSVIKGGELKAFRDAYAKMDGDYPQDKVLVLQTLDKFLETTPLVEHLCNRADQERRMFFNAPKN